VNLAVERTAIGQDRRNPAQTLIALVRRQLVLLSALLCAIVLFNIATNAQLTTADIIGTVYDSSGTVLPNAKVTLMNQGTHETRNAESGAGGEYSFAFLLPGSYSVRVEAQGFTTFTSTVEISAGDRARVDVPLKVGKTSESVEVVSQSPLLQVAPCLPKIHTSDPFSSKIYIPHTSKDPF
jgi:Carboxypeptidase regulatory-like domain